VMGPMYIAYQYVQSLQDHTVKLDLWWAMPVFALYGAMPLYLLGLAIVRAILAKYRLAMLALGALALWAVSLVFVYIGAIGCLQGCGATTAGNVAWMLFMAAGSVGLSWIAHFLPGNVRLPD
jgi:hypothetical protein